MNDSGSMSAMEAATAEPATLKEEKLHCICQTPFDNNRFYIGCDLCNKWFHGDCVGVSELAAETIDEFICDHCKSLVKDVHADERCFLCKQLCDDNRFYVHCDFCHQCFHKACIGIFPFGDVVKPITCPSCSAYSSKRKAIRQLSLEANNDITDSCVDDNKQHYLDGNKRDRLLNSKSAVIDFGFTNGQCYLPFALDAIRQQHKHFYKQHHSKTTETLFNKANSNSRKMTSKGPFQRKARKHNGVDQTEETASTETSRAGRKFKTRTDSKSYEKFKFCDQCGKGFADGANMKRHKLIHTGVKPHKCDQCGSCFRQKSHLKTHRIKHHNKVNYPCSQCDRVYQASDALKLHLKTHSKQGNINARRPYIFNKNGKGFRKLKPSFKRSCNVKLPYLCNECGKGFISLFILRRHCRIHTQRNIFPCEQCDGFYSSTGNLAKHMKKHENLKTQNKRSFRCEQCDKRFISSEHLARHKKIHLIDEDTDIQQKQPFKCDKCDRSYCSFASLVRHTKKHSEDFQTQAEHPFRCHQCDESFSSSEHLVEHNIIHLIDEDTDIQQKQPFKCDKCDQSYRSLQSLVRHKKKHSEELQTQAEHPFRCDQCDESFSFSEDLIKHEKIHLINENIDIQQEQPFKCDKCGKGFCSIGSVQRHNQHQICERPFICDQCKKRFITLPSLIKHQKSHTGSYPHACNHCDKRFSVLKDLIKHNQSHSANEKLHACDDCGTGFSCRPNLRRHKRNNSCGSPNVRHKFGNSKHVETERKIADIDKLYFCDQCEKVFSYKYSLTRHIINYHAEESSGSDQGEKMPCQSSILNKHNDIEDKVHPCDNCSKTFTKLHDLNMHKNTHAGIEMCRRSNLYENDLRQFQNSSNHPTISNADKSHKCNKCGKFYSSRHSLLRHAEIHTGKKHVCDQCGKKFNMSANLLRHKRFHCHQ